jgi:hypothetical protein
VESHSFKDEDEENNKVEDDDSDDDDGDDNCVNSWSVSHESGFVFCRLDALNSLVVSSIAERLFRV